MGKLSYDGEEILSKKEVCELLGISTATLHSLMKGYTQCEPIPNPVIRIGNAVFWRKSDIENYAKIRADYLKNIFDRRYRLVP